MTSLTAKTSDDNGFRYLSELAYKEAGLVLSETKSTMIHSRLRHRMREVNVADLLSYCRYVESDKSGIERRHMISALTTNVTGFFREPHHFDHMQNYANTYLIGRANAGHPIRIWSAGCSKGHEPYSIAMSLLECSATFCDADVRILATDIDPTVLAWAKRGVYSSEDTGAIPEGLLGKYFDSILAEETTAYRANDKLRGVVTFRELNLIEEWPMRKTFDIIFCRNVVIYFDAKTQNLLWPRFHRQLSSTGMIFVGHSERISSSLFNSTGPTVYQPSGKSNPETGFQRKRST